MQQLVSCVRSNKLSFFLFIIVVYLLLSPKFSSVLPNRGVSLGAPEMGMVRTTMMDAKEIQSPFLGGSPVAYTSTQDRLIARETSLSLKVTDVAAVSEQILGIAKTMGGYMIDSSLTNLDDGQSASISIRVPSEKLSDTLAALRGVAVKVVTENRSGTDITDQYSDLDEQLRILQATKTKFESILAKAESVEDMLAVQQQVLSLQAQIDSIKGQQKYMQGTAQYSRVQIYLSTDELSLPYAPVQSWRPALVWKEAVRSLMLHARSIATLAIWAVVYAPVLIIAILVLIVLRRRMR